MYSAQRSKLDCNKTVARFCHHFSAGLLVLLVALAVGCFLRMGRAAAPTKLGALSPYLTPCASFQDNYRYFSNDFLKFLTYPPTPTPFPLVVTKTFNKNNTCESRQFG